MSEEGTVTEKVGRWHGRRGLSTITAMIVMVIVVVLVGSGAYFGLTAVGPSSSTVTGCQPAGSQGCTQFTVHTLSVLAPFKSAQTGQTVPFTVILGSGTSTDFTFNFGDGTPVVTSKVPTVDHVYRNPGTYLVQVSASVNGQPVDNLADLTQISISESYASLSAGNAPNVGGEIISNSTSTSGATAVLQSGGTLAVGASYLALPTNPDFIADKPTLKVTGTTTGASTPTTTTTNTTLASSLSFTNTAGGTWVLSAIGNATGIGPDAGVTVALEYNWTVVVAPSGTHGGLAGAGSGATDPHPGTIIYYSTAEGGAQSLDPSIAYDTVSYEPILNVYEGLIMYNGSETGPTPASYVPVLSTCVPGPASASCAALYSGDTLYNSSTNAFTFPIVKGAMFYDPYTTKGWQVYPSDVAFSIARTMGFADLPAKGDHNGWILTQALLPGMNSPGPLAANVSWDGGIHAPYNNTPQGIFSSFAINDSAYCPASTSSVPNVGCITIFADGNHQAWPYFLELIADQLGSSVESCGWMSATDSNGGDAGIPYWTENNITGAGDQPCTLPGGATSSSQGSLSNWLNTTPATAWDTWEGLGAGSTNNGGSVGRVIGAMVGSGPFYNLSYQPGLTYELKASPVYTANPYCSWTGCMPKRNDTAQKVEVTWETNIAEGEQALAAGVADTAGVPSTDFPLLVQLIEEGKAQALSFPTLSIYFYPFNLNFQLSGAQHFTTSPINVPTNWFSYVGMREFWETSFPYQTQISTILTSNGIATGFNYGGAIPEFMANYYPTNVSWPSLDPANACTVGYASGTGPNSPLCPTYWWNQMTNTSSPYYDPEVAACSTGNPCQVPLVGETGAPQDDEVNQLWVNQMDLQSGGKLRVAYQDINFLNLVLNSLYSTPYNNPMPIFTLGWAPDYPDPTDYMVPLYLPDSTYTASDTVSQMLGLDNSTSCWAQGFSYYVNNPISQACQGAAFAWMNVEIAQAAVLGAGPARVLLYDMIEQIANKLALYVYQYQANEVEIFAPWIDASSTNTNVTIGGGTDFTWWSMTGNGVWG
jgi:PKD domain